MIVGNSSSGVREAPVFGVPCINLGSRQSGRVKSNLIFDPFAGSNTTGYAAERNNRKWISCDLDEEKKQPGRYVTMSSLRFDKIKKGPGWNGPKYNKWDSWK